MVFAQIRVGDEVPNARLAEPEGEGVTERGLRDLVAGKSAVLFGLVGAFVPACRRHHVPNILDNAEALRRAGVDLVAILCPNDPFVVQAFAELYPERRGVRFLADGNLEFAYRAGLAFEATADFLGRRGKRFLIVLRNGIVQRLSVEDDPTKVTCTAAQTVLSGG